MSKIAFITGANKGLGLEIARQLGQQGVTVIIGARDEAKGQAAAAQLKSEGLDAHALKFVVTDAADITAGVEWFAEKFGRLDILVNNAGVMLDWEQPGSLEMYRKTFDTNVFAPQSITQAFLPLLHKSEAGRVVNHSSIIGSIATVGASEAIPIEWLTPAYASSKAALNMLTAIQARQLKDTKIKVNSAHPGWVKTDLGTEAAPMDVTDGAKTAVALALLPDDGPTGGFFHLGESLPW